MDTSDPEIVFDDGGICNHCKAADVVVARWRADLASDIAARTIEKIRKDGAGKQYDCVIGLSGGADSSYLALRAVEEGLRPLIVHLDNGWDAELAVQNIENIVRKLDLDLYTHVIDWPEFRDLQVAYIKASVVDIEVATDHAIAATVWRAAARRNIKYIVTGMNIATESILPRAWFYPKNDLKNLRAIHRTFGTMSLKTYPTMSPYRQMYYARRRGIDYVPLLNLMSYDKAAAISRLIEELGWSPYTGKHGESTFTRFYQGYILPRKFGIDKRKAHLSSLICAGQVTRDEALRRLEAEPMSADEARSEKRFVTKKLQLTEEEFDSYMAQPPRPHTDFPSDFTRIEGLVALKHRLFGRPAGAFD